MRKILVITVVLMFLCAGAASAGLFSALTSLVSGGMKVAEVKPPEVVLQGVKSISIVSAEGKGSDSLANALVGAIRSDARVVQASSGGGLLGAADGLVTAVADSQTGGMASQVGGVVGAVGGALGKDTKVFEKGLETTPFESVGQNLPQADALIDIVTTGDGPSDSSYTAEKIIISGVGKNATKKKITVRCTKREAALNATVTIKSAADGQTLYSGTDKLAVADNVCEGDGRSLASGDSMFTQMGQSMAPRFANKFCPFWCVRKVSLESDKKVKPGNKLAEKEDDWDGAISWWQRVLSADEYNYAAHYNMGVANEIYGNYTEAMKEFEAAEGIQGHKRNQEAIARVENRQAEVARLAAYGMSVEPHEFTAKDVSATKVTTKGNNKDRYPLYTEANESSEEITQVPGGMKIKMLGVEGDFMKIEVLGGKVGYILKKNVKIK